MIQILNKKDCCGCNACGDICPKDAIIFKTDEEGIWYPEVYMDKCIDCHLCEKVCPIINHEGLNKGNSNNPTTYVLQHKSAKERFNSTSGCLYPEIARYFLEHGGYVAGHIFNEDYTVRGYVSNKIEDLELLRNSKYLQSDMHGVYKQVKQLLNEGKQVLFSGCPCQVAAFKTYLRNYYSNLLTADFTCMGIDSPKAFLKYIESLEHQYGSKVAFFKSKSKETGWRDLTNKFIFENGRTYFGTIANDSNLKATFLNVLVRPSCYDCKFKGFPRIADITVGDFWRTPSKEFVDLDDNTGTSYYLANSEKGEAFFKNITEPFRIKKIELDMLFGGNPLIHTSLSKPSFDRADFYRELANRDFSELVDEYYNRAHPINHTKSFFKNAIKAIKWVRFNPVRYFRFLWLNCLSSRVNANLSEGKVLIPDKHCKFKLGKDSKISVKGHCIIGKSSTIDLASGAILRLDTVEASNGELNIIIGKEASASIGYRTVLAGRISIKAEKAVQIGDYSYITQGVSIDDSNGNVVYSDDDSLISAPIRIGEHCLLGQNVIIKRGTQMGDEVIAEPNSTVSGTIPPRVKIAGTPAQIIDKNILWKK